jgi:hypothetical protein
VNYGWPSLFGYSHHMPEPSYFSSHILPKTVFFFLLALFSWFPHWELFPILIFLHYVIRSPLLVILNDRVSWMDSWNIAHLKNQIWQNP